MRYQGRITDWKDDRGFGFITPNGGGDKVFLHISAFGKRQGRPAGNELVTYELVKDAKKGSRAENVLFVGARQAATHRAGTRFLQPILSMLLVAGIGYFGWQEFTARTRR